MSSRDFIILRHGLRLRQRAWAASSEWRKHEHREQSMIGCTGLTCVFAAIVATSGTDASGSTQWAVFLAATAATIAALIAHAIWSSVELNRRHPVPPPIDGDMT